MKNGKKSANIKNPSQRKEVKKYAAVFLLPTIAAFGIGFVWPFVWGIYLSFFRFKTLRFTEFTGFSNYISAFEDTAFFRSFRFTAIFTIVSVAVVNTAAFAVAFALTKSIKGRSLFRTVFFMPNLIGGIVLGYIWKIILDAVIIKYFGSTLALNENFGFWGLVILVSWQQIGYMMIIYIAGLESIPHEYTEAAKIDGASSGQLLRYITLPSVMPSVTICTFLTLTNGFKLFDQNLALTDGKPFDKTQMLALNIYKSFYESNINMGVGQAKAVIFFVLVAAIALLQLYFTKSREA